MADIFDNPSANVFDAYGKAVAAGQLYNDTLRRNQAFNALAKVYGPEAGDPKLAADMEALHQSKQMDPLLVQQQSLQNAGLGQTNAFNKENNPLIVKSNEIANATNQNTLDQTQKVQKAAQVHGALSTSISTLGSQLQGVTDPNQRLALFDQQIEQVAPLVGVDAATLKQQLAQARAAVAAQGADALPQIQQQLDASVDANLTPAERVQLQQQKTSLAIQQSKFEEQQAKTAATVKSGGLTGAQLIAQQKLDAAKSKAMLTDAAGYLDYSDNVDNIAGKGGAIDQAIDFITTHPDSTGTVGGITSGISGMTHDIIGGSTSGGQLAQLLVPITSNVLLDKLKSLKESSKNGSSGFGSLSEREGDTLRNSIASVNQSQPGKAVIIALEKVRKTMLDSKNRLGQVYRVSYGGADPAAVLSAGDTTAPPQADATGTAPAAPPPPAGVDPEDWKFMSPEEQALWQ